MCAAGIPTANGDGDGRKGTGGRGSGRELGTGGGGDGQFGGGRVVTVRLVRFLCDCMCYMDLYIDFVEQRTDPGTS